MKKPSVEQVHLPDGKIELQVNGIPVHQTMIKEWANEMFEVVLTAVAVVAEGASFHRDLDIPATGWNQAVDTEET